MPIVLTAGDRLLFLAVARSRSGVFPENDWPAGAGGRFAKTASAGTKQMGKRGRNRQSRRRTQRTGPVESRVAEATTVGWMLTTVVTLVADLGLLVAWAIVARSDAQSLPEAVAVLPGLLLFTATITGILAVLLVPAVYFLRLQYPPWQITVVAIGIGLFPIACRGVLAF